MRLRIAETKDYRNIEELYEQAFPKEEKKPFHLLLRKRPDVGLLVLEDGDDFCGFFSLILCDKTVFIDYFAVSAEMRGKSYGSQALALLKDYYPDRTLALEIETPKEDAPNQEQRLRRLSFYQRNGFSLNGIRAMVFVCDYSLMVFKGEVSMEAYLEAIKIMYEREDVEQFVTSLV